MSVKKDVIISFLDGDNAAFQQIYYGYKKVACFIIFSYLNNPNDVEDIYHDALVKVMENKNTITSPQKFESFLLTTVKHEAINYGQRTNRIILEEEIEEKKITYDEPTIDDLLPYNIAVEEKRIISLRIVFDMPWKELCQLIDMPISTAKSKYRIALDKIKKEIKNGQFKKADN